MPGQILLSIPAQPMFVRMFCNSLLPLISVEIIGVSSRNAAIYLRDECEFSIARRDIGLEAIGNVKIILFEVVLFVQMIASGQAGFDAVFGEIGIVKVVVFKADERRKQLVLCKNRRVQKTVAAN